LKQILIAGGSGLIGSSLAKRLKARGHKVTFLSRKGGRKQSGVDIYEWDIQRSYIEGRAFENAQVVINLSGAGITDQRWNEKRKQEMYNSRINGTKLLVEHIKKHGYKVKKFISASAIGIYGNRNDEILFEDSMPGDDFLARICCDWEKEAEKVKSATTGNIYLAILRIGLVLSQRGGYFKRIKQFIKWWMGAPATPGNQHQSWIHMEDLCNMIIYLIENEQIEGTFNAVASEPATAEDIVANIAQRLQKPYFLPPVPLWILKLLFGQMADILTASQYVNNEKIREAGFKFKYPDLNSSLNNLTLE
jgi:uncharacterized protein (TIGR01777 family)